MKKIISSIFLSIVCLTMGASLCSCGVNNIKKAHLDYAFEYASEIKDINDSRISFLNYQGLASKIAKKESFLLVLYNEGCGCWDGVDGFQPVLIDFLNTYKIKVDCINVDELIVNANKGTYNLHFEKSDMPAIAIFSEGNLQVEAHYIKNRDLFKDHRKLYDFISQNAVLPKRILIDKETLDSFIQEDKEFNLYIARRECGDCQAADREVLSKWNYKVDSVENPLYIFDLQDYQNGDKQGWYCEHCDLTYSLDEIGEDHKCPECEEEMTITLYQHLKDIYGLSEKNNPTLGLSTGAVPTFQRRKGNQIKDMVVVLNDSQSEGVISSYFTSERVQNMPFLHGSELKVDLDGMTFSKVDDELDWRQNWRIYKSEYNAQYHYPILELFLSTYVN